MDFSKFDKSVNMDQIAKQIEEAKNNQNVTRELPAGNYVATIEKMELGATKDGRPMFRVMMRVTQGEYKRFCMFMNRVIYGTKNDGNMINSVIGWLNNLDPTEPVEWVNYSELNESILDVFEELEGIEWSVQYDPDAFNSISVVGELTDDVEF